jgi:hypothetical protein
MPFTISITDPLGGQRLTQPVSFTVPAALSEPLWHAETSDGTAVICQRLSNGSTATQTVFTAVLTLVATTQLTLIAPVPAEQIAAVPGIRELPGREADCFVRLDTGAFDLELCAGTAQGTGASKWGIRHFRGLFDGFELLPSGNNAIGGFYGPFFTPENGLINPPEHTVVQIEVIEHGPVLHKYRMHGTIPDGLLDELKDKTFSIDWTFFHAAAWFERCYRVDPFRTVINGRSVDNKITVGDEFEGGHGKLVFDRFAAQGGTRYRSGDPYAGELVAMVSETLAQSTATGAKFEEFRRELSNMESAHWDLYWRLFCAWEKVLTDDEIRDRMGRVGARSHVLADLVARRWQLTEDPVNVSAVPHETIFPGPAAKTVEFDEESGRAMVWWTSEPSGAFQIVQRRQSGWVNWGTNGENECPELPVGATIRTAYGPFARGWVSVADQLETPPHCTVLS